MKLLVKLSILLLVVSFTGCYTQLATRSPDAKYRNYESWEDDDYVYDDSTEYYEDYDSTDYEYDYAEDPLIFNDYHYNDFPPFYYNRYYYFYPYSSYFFVSDWYWYPGIWDSYYVPWYSPWYYDRYYSGYWGGYYYSPYYYSGGYHSYGSKYRTNKYASIRDIGNGRGHVKRSRDSYTDRTRKDGY